MLSKSQFERLIARGKELDHAMTDLQIFKDQKKLKDTAKESAQVQELISAYREYQDLLGTIADEEDILKNDDDPELVELAREELEIHQKEKVLIENRIRSLLLPHDPNDSRNVIVEIRAGTGGEESGLFAADLFRMYSRYAELNRWKIDVMSSNSTGVGGFKEIVFSVEGSEVYSKMKYESGTHRVQRVPQTESSGRIHTSAATVAIMPEADEVDVEIKPNEIRVDVYRSSGPGGQSVNTTDSAVRITHVPTGLVVSCQDEKSQHKNRSRAMKVLRSRLLERAINEQQERLSHKRKLQVGSGDRSGKIRTYNFPQGRITDHRIGLTLYKLDAVLNGELDELISSLTAADEKEQLEELSEKS
ncbi:MAG: peptide chain release factor 1 [Candidatus Cloacimonetes bacterium 4572_55]|nr:MAG: peptide chain release factor 1 [Candidatus Cloacimonetes bacterium 4572_55]